jgi:hypothetical protein
LSFPLPAGAFAASSLFAMPIIRHYSGIHRSTERQEQVLCQSCLVIQEERTLQIKCGSGLARESSVSVSTDAN